MKKSDTRLQPAHELWKLYDSVPSRYAFNAGNRRAAQAWQRRTRKALADLVGFQDSPVVPFAVRKLESIDRGDHIREKILMRTAPHSLMPVYILKPKGAKGALPTVLAFHGHGYGVKDIVGLTDKGKNRNAPPPLPAGYHKDFGIEICRRGFLVACPEISCFGERQTDFSYLKGTGGSPPTSTCTHTSFLASHLGGTALGIRVRDAMRLVDYLATRKDADTARLGAMGISGGGMHSFFSTALDTRIKASVVSGYFCHWKKSIHAMFHCPCNFVPGLHEFGEIHNIAGLIAPRPMLIEAADKDPIFPIAGVKAAVRDARRIYKVFSSAKDIETDYFKGGHQISGARAYDFLLENLA